MKFKYLSVCQKLIFHQKYNLNNYPLVAIKSVELLTFLKSQKSLFSEISKINLISINSFDICGYPSGIATDTGYVQFLPLF